MKLHTSDRFDRVEVSTSDNSTKRGASDRNQQTPNREDATLRRTTQKKCRNLVILLLVPTQLYTRYAGSSSICCVLAPRTRLDAQVRVRFGTTTLGPNNCFKLHCCVAVKIAGFNFALPASTGLQCTSAATLQLGLQVSLLPGLPSFDKASALMRP